MRAGIVLVFVLIAGSFLALSASLSLNHETSFLRHRLLQGDKLCTDIGGTCAAKGSTCAASPSKLCPGKNKCCIKEISNAIAALKDLSVADILTRLFAVRDKDKKTNNKEAFDKLVQLFQKESQQKLQWITSVVADMKAVDVSGFSPNKDDETAVASFLKNPPPSSATLILCSESSIPLVSMAFSVKDPFEINKNINAGYSQFARCMQSIALGNPPDDTPFKIALPVWFVVAPYASRGVGLGIKSTQKFLSTAVAGSSGSFFKDVLSIGDRIKAIGSSISLSGNAVSTRFELKKELALSASAPSSSILGKAKDIAGTLQRALVQGNHDIYADIGGAAAQYLHWRYSQTEKVTPEKVINSFGPAYLGGNAETDKKNVKSYYDFAINTISTMQGKGSTWNDIDPNFAKSLSPPLTTNAKPLVVAAFALYEQAGIESKSDPRQRDWLVAVANVFLAYQEQFFAVKSAFETTLHGVDADRTLLFSFLTPGFTLDFTKPGGKELIWRVTDYCDARPKTCKLSDLNWGLLPDRWAPILDAFRFAYANIPSLWPMPNPDPTVK